MSMPRTTVISPNDAGKTLRHYLTSRFTYQNADEWAQHIGEGRILLNGGPCTGEELLSAGINLTFSPIPYEEPPICTDWSLIFGDENYLFIEKPAFLPCHPGGIYLKHTLLTLLTEQFGTVFFVNRLDRETSGIVVIARNADSAAYANTLMAERKILKEYEVLVEGNFPEKIDADGFLVRDTDSPIRKRVKFVPIGTELFPEGKTPSPLTCRTEFALIRPNPDGTSLVKAVLHTGRTHQIRATLCSLGYPVVGDKLYGQDQTVFLRFIDNAMTDADRTLLRLDRQALHCTRTSFTGKSGFPYDITSRAPFTDV